MRTQRLVAALFAGALSLACLAAAVYLCVANNREWGWFLLAAILFAGGVAAAASDKE